MGKGKEETRGEGKKGEGILGNGKWETITNLLTANTRNLRNASESDKHTGGRGVRASHVTKFSPACVRMYNGDEWCKCNLT